MLLSSATDKHLNANNLTRNDNIKLLLNSIAALNHNVAKLIDVGIEEIRFVVDERECDKLSTTDIITINQNIIRVLRNAMNLQVLLQLKLDDILKATLGTISVSVANNKNLKAKRNTLDKVPSTISGKRKHTYVSVV